jgi:ATP-dependent Clp protease protease subunit
MTGHIFIEGEIGSQVTSKTVRADISNYPQATEWTVHFNSGGGDVYEGYQIGSILKNLGKPTTALIGAMCASIATYDALCCDHVVMNPHGDFMIHLPTGTLSGTAEDLRRGAEQLDRIKSELIDRYMTKVAKKGVTMEQLSAMIDKETSMSPSEALQYGFVDEVREKLKAVAKMDVTKFNDMTKDEAKGMFEAIGAKLDSIMNAMKPKNSVAITLADGSMVESSADAPEGLVGSVLTDEQGVPLPAGQVETADGQVLTIVEGGVVESMAPKTEDKADDVEAKIKALEQENAALKQQLADAGQKASASEDVAKVQAENLSKFKNQVEELKASFEALKSQTFGDSTVPTDAPDKKFSNEKQVDPLLDMMAQSMGQAFITSRPKF